MKIFLYHLKTNCNSLFFVLIILVLTIYCFRVAILSLRHFAYTLNNRLLRSSTNLAIKALESSGCHVVPVCLEVWENLPDFEKIPYLMQAIKERTDNDLKVSESVI